MAEERVANLVVLLELNPHWGISVLDNMVRQANKTSLVVTSPSLPLSCIVKNRAYDAISYLCFVAAGKLKILAGTSSIRCLDYKR